MTTDYERFLSKVDASGGPDACHLWTAYRVPRGYGSFSVKSRMISAHRWILGYLRGLPLSRQEHALHSCDNPPCVNPRHLYIGTHQQNMRDAVDRGRHRNAVAEALRARTHCLNGHEYSPDNTWMRGPTRRVCRQCARDRKLTEGSVRRQRLNRTNPDECIRGHPYTPENTYVRSQGTFACRQCKRDLAKRRPCGLAVGV